MEHFHICLIERALEFEEWRSIYRWRELTELTLLTDQGPKLVRSDFTLLVIGNCDSVRTYSVGLI